MLGTASRSATERAGREARRVDAQARLVLAETLLASLDLQSSVQAALNWLSEHCRVTWSVCLARDPRGRLLVPVADHGVSPTSWGEFTLYVDDRSHPLIRALWAAQPSFFGGDRQLFWPQIAEPFHAIPLRSNAVIAGEAEGLLLVSTDGPKVHPDIRWVATVLGDQVARLRSRDALAETRFGRERTLLHGIINSVTDPILLTDTEGRLILSNAAAERLFTAPDDASEGWRQAVGLNNMLFSAALSSSAVQQDRPARRELVLVDPFEGSDLLTELLSSSLPDSREGTAIVSVLRNVTDLGRATKEIEESYQQLRAVQAEARDQRRRLELVIDSVADPILVTDPAGKIVLMNTRAERLFGVRADAPEEVHRRMQTNGAHFSSFLSSLLTSGTEKGWRGETTLVDPETGVAMPVEAIAGTVSSEQGELVWIVTILHDRTQDVERARLYDELKQASEQLEAKVQAATLELAQQNELLRRQRFEVEQASELKSRFLANMSHEFRTPLNAILGYTQMLLQGIGGKLTVEQRTNLERIDSNARHLLTLINDILDLSRIEKGEMPLHLSAVSVPELIDELLAELEPIIKRSKLGVTKSLSRELPRIQSDRPKVKQILLNLFSNALKFTPRGCVSISAALDQNTNRVSITVKDTGVGIREADQERMFEDFQQLDMSPTRGHGGTGLGLSICRRLAAILGGQVTVESEVGKGSAFTVWLPVTARQN